MDGQINQDMGSTGIKFGISQKLSILILIVSVFPLLILGIFNYIHNMNVLRADAENLLSQTASGMAGQVNEWIDKNTRSLIMVSKQPGIQSMEKNSQDKIIKSFQEEFPWVYLVFTVDKSGHNISRTDNGEAQNYSDRGYFKEVMSGKAFAFETLIGKTSKKPALVMAVPIKSGDEIIGVLGAAMNIDTLSNTVATWKNGRTGFAFMVDGENKVISHPKPEYNLEQKNLSDDPLIKAARSGSFSKPVYFKNETGQSVLALCVKVSNDWVLSVRQDESEIFASIRQFQILAIAILLLSTLISVILAVIVGKSITKPVLFLADAANKMSLGEMDLKIDIDTKDEIGVLAESISRLQTSLVIALKRLKK